MQQQNNIAAGIIAIVQSLLPFLVLIHVLHWTSDTIAAAMLVVTNIVTTAGLIFANKQTATALSTPPPSGP